VWRRLQAVLGPETARNFLFDAVAAGLYAIFQGLTNPFVTVLAVRRGAQPWEVGWLNAAPAASLLLGTWYARLAAGRRKVPVVVVSTAFARLWFLLAGWSHDLVVYLVAITAFNLVNAAGSPAYTAVEREIYHQRWRGRLMGGVKFALGLGQFVTMLVAGELLDRWHAGWVFTVAVAFGLASAAVFAGVREPPPRPEERSDGLRTSALGLLREDPRFARLIASVMLVGGANFFVSPAYPLVWVHRLDLSNEGVAWITAAWALAWMVCYPLWGRLSDRHRPAQAVRVAYACYLVPPLLYALGIVHLPEALLAGWAQGMGDSALDVGWQNHVMRLGGDRVGLYAGVYYTFMGVRGTALPLLGSLVATAFGLRTVFAVGVALIAAGLYVARELPDGPLARRAVPSAGVPA
jgi:MFS family permease